MDDWRRNLLKHRGVGVWRRGKGGKRICDSTKQILVVLKQWTLSTSIFFETKRTHVKANPNAFENISALVLIGDYEKEWDIEKTEV